jgi:type II secretory pathway pseudopilin PulG
MLCPRCTGQIDPNTAACTVCGASLTSADGADRLARPGLITVLAILQFVAAVIWMLGALAFVAVVVTASGPDQGQSGVIVLAVIAGVVGVVQALGGIGLLQLKPYGRTVQLVCAWVGLLGIPVGTIISVLILIYMYKPGIKVLFSGKQAFELTPDERAQIAQVTRGSAVPMIAAAVVAGVLVLAMIGILAAAAIPSFLRMRMVANEVSAISSLREINSGQAAYAESCAAGAYAVTLEDLAKPAAGGGPAFVSPGLGTSGVAKSGYRVTLAKDSAEGVADMPPATGTCNGSTGTPASSYFAKAEPVIPGNTGARYFATDARGMIFSSAGPISNPIVESGTVTPIQ